MIYKFLGKFIHVRPAGEKKSSSSTNNSLELTTAHAPEHQNLKVTVVVTVLAVALGTNFGIYNNAVVNNLQSVLELYINTTRPVRWLVGSKVSNCRFIIILKHSKKVEFQTSSFVWSIVVALVSLGAALGTILAPLFAECAGRRWSLILSASLSSLGALLCSCFTIRFEMLLIGRFLLGVSFGLGLPLASAFVMEIAPVSKR